VTAEASVQFTVRRSVAEAAATTADRFVDAARRAFDERGRFYVALSGGSTPKQVYPLLASPPRRDAVDWSRVEFFWGDERAVPPDHPESNFGVAYQMLLANLAHVRPEAIHRMPAEARDLDAAALAYEAEMRLTFELRGTKPPSFDLIWLGMGPDGHVASLFPGTAGLDERERWVIANWVPSLKAWRMSLTFPVLNAAREAIVVATGSAKADALRRVRGGDTDLPASRLRPSQLEWIVDAAAAGEGR
jgi:6-phosphogluconolactonase